MMASHSRRVVPATCAFLLWTMHILAGQRAGPQDVVRSELRAFHQELNRAATERDRAALERLFADEFLWVHTIGGLVSRADHINGIMTAPPGLTMTVPPLDDL